MTKKRVAMISDCYALPQVKKGAKGTAIKKIHRRLGLKYNPDVNSCENRKADNSFAKTKGEADG